MGARQAATPSMGAMDGRLVRVPARSTSASLMTSALRRVGLTAYRRLPLYPYKQTSLPCVGMSQMCQKATYQLVPHDIKQAASVGGFNSSDGATS